MEFQNRDKMLLYQALLYLQLNTALYQLIYHLQNSASLTAGYAYVKTWPFDESINSAVTSNENRLWEQLILKNNLWRIDFEHRYRLEQRWVKTEVVDYSTRMRYRLLFLLPLSNANLKPKTFFIVTYNEIFLNINFQKL